MAQHLTGVEPPLDHLITMLGDVALRSCIIRTDKAHERC